MDTSSWFCLQTILQNEVVKYCDLRALCALICTCKSFKSTLDTEELWRKSLVELWNVSETTLGTLLKRFLTYKEAFVSVYLVGEYWKSPSYYTSTNIFSPVIDEKALTHIEDFLDENELKLLCKVVAIKKIGAPGDTREDGQELGVFEFFTSPSKTSTRYKYIDNYRSEVHSYENHCYLSTEAFANSLPQLLDEVFQQTSLCHVDPSPPRGWLDLGLWTIADWKTWTISTMTSTKHQYNSVLSSALCKRYKAVTIFVTYLPGFEPKELELKDHSMLVLIQRCCNIFKIGWRRQKQAKLLTSDNIEVTSTRELKSGQFYTLYVPAM